MSFTQAGADVVLVRNDATGRFDLQWGTDGNPVYGDDQSHAVLGLICAHKGEYWADETGERGSLLHTVKQDRKTTPGTVQAYIEDALSPLLDARKILKPQPPPGALNAPPFVQVTRRQPGRVDVTVNYTTPAGAAVAVRASVSF